MNVSLTSRSFLLVCCLGLIICNPAVIDAALTEISAADMDRDMICQDMELCPLGSISGTHPCFTSISIREAFLLGDWVDDTDVLSSGPDGNALCCYRDMLTIVEPDGDLYDADAAGAGYRFELFTGITARQFALRNVDQTGWSATISVFKGGVELFSLSRTMSGYDPTYFESSDDFDAFQIVTTGSTGGWCVDDLCVARFSTMSGTPTPTPTVTPTATLPDISVTQSGENVFLLCIIGLIVCSTIGANAFKKI